MVRVFCYYTFSGFKIFNTEKFESTDSEGNKYVSYVTIKNALKSVMQDLVVTENNDCGLPSDILSLFSHPGIKIVLTQKQDTAYLYVLNLSRAKGNNGEDRSASYLFVTTDEIEKLRMLACLMSIDFEKVSKELGLIVDRGFDESNTQILVYKPNVLSHFLSNLTIDQFDVRYKQIIEKKYNFCVFTIPNYLPLLNKFGLIPSYYKIDGQDQIRLERGQTLISFDSSKKVPATNLVNLAKVVIPAIILISLLISLLMSPNQSEVRSKDSLKVNSDSLQKCIDSLMNENSLLIENNTYLIKQLNYKDSLLDSMKDTIKK